MLIDKQLEDAYDAWCKEKDQLITVLNSIEENNIDNNGMCIMPIITLEHVIDFIERSKF